MGTHPAPAGGSGSESGLASRALSEWLEALTGPQDPPFSPGAAFPDSEWSHFFRMFAVSTTLGGTVVGVDRAVNKLVPQHLTAPLLPSAQSLLAITVFAFIGVFYSVYGKVFGIKIGFRQALFSFALILVPWFPLYMVLKTGGKYFGVLWFFILAAMGIYVVYLLGKAIHIVSGASWMKIVLSFIVAALLAILAVISRVGLQAT